LLALLDQIIYIHLQKLSPLKLRVHGVSEIPYDERYTPYIDALGLLPFFQLVTRSTPYLNAAQITALVDRWRPETHSFHLRTGEMTVTLQDMSMVFALPIDGEPLCLNTDSEGWHAEMMAMIGTAPTENKDKNIAAGATYTWIINNFQHCPADADVAVVRTYARVYIWYVLTRTIFSDSKGNVAQWIWLKALTVLDKRWSWGTAALAFLYRQVKNCSLQI
jgi:hypothetical protein